MRPIGEERRYRWGEGTMSNITQWFTLRWLAVLATTVLGALFVAGCGPDSGTGGNNCTVSSVTVNASPSGVAANAMSTLTATVSESSSCSNAVTWTASPAGGTLVSSGDTATFTAPTAGTYTITATSSADTSKSGSTAVTVAATVACGAPNGIVVNHPGNISAD